MHIGTKSIHLILVLSLALMAVGMGGCQRDPAAAPAETPTDGPATAVAPSETSKTAVKLYYVRGEEIGVAGRDVQAKGQAEQPHAALQALVGGPNAEEREFGLTSAIPEGTKALGVVVEDGLATANLSKQFESGGGSLSMLLRVAQVVCTLTQFNGVKAVAFKIDGKPVKSIGGEGIVVEPPVSRSDVEDQLPAILIEAPYPGQTVSSPLTVSGSSNVFEATHQLNVTDPDGLVVAQKTITATSGTGTRGTWTATVEFPKPKFDGVGSVITFTQSPKDGSRTDIVEIPVRMPK